MANKTVYPFGTGGQLPSSIGIINDLTTGGADKALSAEQGKVLNYMTAKAVESNLSGTSPLAKAIMSDNGWVFDSYVDGDGNIVQSEGYCVTPYIPITNLSSHNVLCVYRFSAHTDAAVAYFNSSKTRVYGNYLNTDNSRLLLNLGSASSTAAYLRITLNQSRIRECMVVDLTSGTTIFDGMRYMDALNAESNVTLSSYRDGGVVERARVMPTPFDGLNQEDDAVVASANYTIYVLTVKKGDRVDFFARNSDAKNARYSFSRHLPEAGGSVTGMTTLSSVTQVSETETAPFDGYFFFSHATGSFTTQCFYVTRETSKHQDAIIQSRIANVPLKGLTNGSRYTDWTSTNGTDTVKTSVMLVPYDSVELKVRIKAENLRCRIMYGNIITGTSTSTKTDYMEDNACFMVPKDVANLCVIFYSIDGTNLSPSTVQGYVDDGLVAVTYMSDIADSVARNNFCETYVKAAMYLPKTTPSQSYLHNIPVFAHVSDVHGDMVRMRNALDYCAYLGVDAIINTGDTVCNKGSDGCETYHSLVADSRFPTLVCVGNHDGWYPDYGGQTQNEKLYADLIQPNSQAFGYVLPSSSEYEDAATYYYKDFSSLKLRVIAMNQYESGLQDWSNVGRISQQQIDWFISTLASTPQDYGVILMYHAPMAVIDMSSDYDKFFEKFTNKIESVTVTLSADPIRPIIDAFISGGSASGSYTQKKNGATETVSWSADFTSLNSGVEFICHISGHKHCDFIGYYRGTQETQLMLNVTTSQSIYGHTHYYKANESEMPRGGRGSTEDAFNVYGIDRTNGVVKVARVGSNVSALFAPRDYMEIPYK